MKRLTPSAAILLATLTFTGCHSMSPEGADAFDAAAANPAPLPAPATTTTTTTPATAPASRPAGYPLTEPAHPRTIAPQPWEQLMPIPEPVPRH